MFRLSGFEILHEPDLRDDAQKSGACYTNLIKARRIIGAQLLCYLDDGPHAVINSCAFFNCNLVVYIGIS